VSAAYASLHICLCAARALSLSTFGSLFSGILVSSLAPARPCLRKASALRWKCSRTVLSPGLELDVVAEWYEEAVALASCQWCWLLLLLPPAVEWALLAAQDEE
jgi:hypothetical protein